MIAKSFARIHETNLKKQGILALRFEKTADYELVRENDRVSFIGLSSITPGEPVTMLLSHMDGRMETMKLLHSYTPDQIQWFKAGSALNLMKGK